MKFKVGDEVILNSLTNKYYSVTKEGSKGIITKKRAHKTWGIKFTFIPNNHSLVNETLPIIEDCIQILTPLDKLL